MKHTKSLINGGILASLLASLLVLSACGKNSTAPASYSNTATSNTLKAKLSGGNEVPAVVSPGSGTFKANIDQKTRVLKWTLSYSGLSGPITAAHFHGPALAKENAGVAVPITGNLAVSPIEQAITLSVAQMDELMAGKWYVNLHTEENPKGEIRGQVTVQKSVKP
jgi:hypothetical protein